MSQSQYIKSLVIKAKKLNKTIVLPEGEDERVLTAAHIIAEEKIAKVILLGVEADVKAFYAKNNWNFDNIELIEPSTSDRLPKYAELLYNLRKEKGMSQEDATKWAQNHNYFGTLMVKSGDADGMVSGANHSTADTVRPALQIIKSAKKGCAVSSFFIMVCDNSPYLFSDCAITINPNEKELADIAIETANSMIQFDIEPKLAMLSYSTHGSGRGESVDKVKNAFGLVKEILATPEYANSNIIVDGELQADAALDAIACKQKAPDSIIAGQAHGLIFPNIDAGNICYKTVQRLGKAEAYGPVLQGLNAPINDLSRGCVVDEIIGVVAITILQSNK